MLASNLIAWTRNFLKMGGMENAFFFLLPFWGRFRLRAK